MSKMYSFSYNVGVRTQVIVRRKWWNLFGKDHVEFAECSTRKCVTGLTKVEADILISAFQHGPTISLIKKIIGPSSYWQVEEGSIATSAYISTTSTAGVETMRTNLLHNSEPKEEELNVESRIAVDNRWHKAARDLLAVIHCDGGHHIGKVGFVQACKDAESIVRKLRSDDARSKSNEWTSTKPTNGGVYWVQLDRGLAPATVEVYRLDEDDVWRMRVVGTPTGILASTIASCQISSLHSALWNGPMSAPTLP